MKRFSFLSICFFIVHLLCCRSSNPAQSAGTIHFLFTEDKKFLNSHIWSFFFHNVDESAVDYKVFIYDQGPGSFVGPKGFNFKIVARSDDFKPCESPLSAMYQLLNESMADSRSPKSNDMFIFLSSDAIPIKTLNQLYSSFYPTDTIDPFSHYSKFCLAPVSSWETSTITSSGPTKKIVKHEKWFMLNRTDAAIIADKIANNYEISDNYPALHKYDKENQKCVDEYWFFNALYGEITYSENEETSNDLSNWNSIYFKQSNGQSWNFEQGYCFMYEFDELRSKISPFYKSITLDSNLKVHDSVILNPSFQMLTDLHLSENFFFMRKIHSEQPLHHVRYHFNDKKIEELTFLEALKKLSHIPSTKTSDLYGVQVLEHSRFKRASGDNKGLKVLVVSVDDRLVNSKLDSNDYVSMVAVLQQHYCVKNGYDYISFRTDNKLLKESLKERYKHLDLSRTFDEPKYGSACFHPGLDYLRASSWGKLPPLWFLSMEYGKHYDYIWFMDSDATPNPVHSNISLSDAFENWEKTKDQMVYYGNKNIKEADFVFFSNFPWRDDLPCAGTFLFKPQTGEAILREWWDFDLPSKNFVDFMEQDALWYMLEADSSYKFLLNSTTVSLLNLPQFPSRYYGVNDLWMVHIPNYEVKRNKYFRTMLKTINRNNEASFIKAIEHIEKHSQMITNTLDLAELMERKNLEESMKKYPEKYSNITANEILKPVRRNKYPPVRKGRDDDYWHTPRNMGDRPNPPPIDNIYNGFVIQFDGDDTVYLVENGKRRLFPNYHTFSKMGYDVKMIIHFKMNNEPIRIPLGPPLPAL